MRTQQDVDWAEARDLLQTIDPAVAQKLLDIVEKEFAMSGCFSQYCKGNLHAHAPTS